MGNDQAPRDSTLTRVKIADNSIGSRKWKATNLFRSTNKWHLAAFCAATSARLKNHYV